MLFSTVAALFHILTNTAERVQFLHILADTRHRLVFYNGHPKSCEVVPHWVRFAFP